MWVTRRARAAKSTAFLALGIVVFLVGCFGDGGRRAAWLVRGLALDSAGRHAALFLTDEQKRYRLLVVDIEGGRSRVIAKGETDLMLEAAGWQPGTEHLCYLESSGLVWRRMLHISDSGGRRLSRAELPRGFVANGMAWKPDGSVLVVADEALTEGSSTRIRSFSAELRLLGGTDTGCRVADLQWNPDDWERLIVLAHGQRGMMDLVSVDATTGSMLNKIAWGWRVMPGMWRYCSGGTAYFASAASHEKQLEAGLYAWDTQHREVRQLSDDKVFGTGSSRRIAWACGLGKAAVPYWGKICLVDLRTGHLATYSQGPEDDYPALSQDFRVLAFIRGGRKLVVQELPTGQTRVAYDSAFHDSGR